jgi:very-short-patch-repair endonuclease
MAKGDEGYKLRTITCVSCGETVTRRMRPKQKYCSLPCYRTSARPQRKTGVVRACKQCGAEFYAAANRIAKGGGRFCSLACHNVHQGRNKTEHECKVCDKTFRWSPSRTAGGAYNITYCSLGCRDEDPDYRARLIAVQASWRRGRTTSAEVAGYAILDSLGIEYEPQATFAGKFTPDATIPSAQLVVQFDGDYWHDRKGTSTEKRIRRRVALDRSQDAYIRACGWQVVRLWDSDLKSDPEGCAEKIRQHLRLPS